MAPALDHIPSGSRDRGARRRGANRGLALAPAALEVVLAVGAATAVVALMQSAAPPAGLGVLYLLAVLEVAVRRGEVAALATAVLGVLTLNYFFITPRQRLSIAHTQDLCAASLKLRLTGPGVGREASPGASSRGPGVAASVGVEVSGSRAMAMLLSLRHPPSTRR